MGSHLENGLTIMDHSKEPGVLETHTSIAGIDLQDESGNASQLSFPPHGNESTSSSWILDDGTGSALPVGSVDGQQISNVGGRTKLQTTLIIFALCSALFLAALDVTIVATAIPTISAEFHSSSGYTWIGSAFLLANASVIPVFGKVSDIWGRKSILMIAVAIFWVGSLISGISGNMGTLLAGRVIQGIGAGGITPLVNICISDLFSPRDRAFYYSMVGVTWALAGSIGPLLGGTFTTYATWRWCFYINLPISFIGFIIISFVLKLHNPRTPILLGLAAIDWTGSLLVIVGTVMLLFGLEFGGVSYPWTSATVICLILFGAVTIVLFLLVEARFAKFPLIPLRLFSRSASLASFTICFFHGVVYLSGSYYLPLYFQGVLQADPLFSGVYLLPFALSLSFFSAMVGIMIKMTGQARPPIVFGVIFMVLGFGLFLDMPSSKYWPKIILYQIVAGIGCGPLFQGPLISLQSAVETGDIGSATAAFAFVRQLSGAISIVAGGVIFQNNMGKQYPTLLQKLGPEIADRLTGSNAAGSVDYVAGLAGSEGTIARYAFWEGWQSMYIFYTVVAGLALLSLPFIGRDKLSREHQEHKTGLQSLELVKTKLGKECDIESGGAQREVK